MDITVTFQDGKWVTEPDPAIVLLGTRIRWIVRSPRSDFARLRWTIDFVKHSPFRSDQRLTVVTTNTGLGEIRGNIAPFLIPALEALGLTEEALVNHVGTTKPVSADEPGSFKYDLHLQDEETEAGLGDDDPRLFVSISYPPTL
jgi:hypothetical protein